MAASERRTAWSPVASVIDGTNSGEITVSRIEARALAASASNSPVSRAQRITYSISVLGTDAFTL
jgi:hypothetical protein